MLRFKITCILTCLTGISIIQGYSQRMVLNPNNVIIRDSIPSLRVEMVNVTHFLPEQAFFCRLESKVNKNMPFPIFFRLGQKDYVDYLELKHPSQETFLKH